MNGDYGGGGFLHSSPGGSQGSPGGGERKQAQQSLRPVTIKQILSVEQSHSDSELAIDQVEVGQVTVVAQVMSIQAQQMNSVVYVDDGTGRIEARLWSGPDNESELEQYGSLEQKYVRVTGIVKAFGNKKYINANAIRPITDMHELYFHLMEAMFVTLAHQRGPPPKPGQETSTTTTNGGASHYTAYTAYSSTAAAPSAPSAPSMAQYSSCSPLAQKIMQYILAQPRTEEGVHVGAIARHVKANAELISNALDELNDNGHVFSTIDETHFNPSG